MSVEAVVAIEAGLRAHHFAIISWSLFFRVALPSSINRVVVLLVVGVEEQTATRAGGRLKVEETRQKKKHNGIRERVLFE